MESPLSPSDFTAEVFSRVRNGGPGVAEAWLREYVSAGHIDSSHYRVTQAHAQINDAKAQDDRYSQEIAKQPSLRLSKVAATPAPLQPSGGVPSRIWPLSKQGLYQSSYLTNPISADLDISHLSVEQQSVFRQANFGDDPVTILADRVFVASNAQLSALGWSDATVVTEDGFFHPTRSGRLPRLTGNTLLAEVEDEVEMAYILPFPYNAKNYYHSLTEMAYALRHIYLVSPDTPIVYDVDPFDLLPFLCSALQIDRSRLVRRHAFRNSLIRTAVLPDTGPYYWSSQFVGFFRNIGIRSGEREVQNRRLYISRRNSGRALPNEMEVERYLSGIGFEIVYAENLHFREQVELFSGASIIVGVHGAGMTNMTFSPDNCKIIEIFRPDFVNRDFQKRSQFVTPYYTPILFDEQHPEISLKQIADILSLEK